MDNQKSYKEVIEVPKHFRQKINKSHLKDVWNYIKSSIKGKSIERMVIGDYTSYPAIPFVSSNVKKVLTRKKFKGQVTITQTYKEMFLEKYPELKIKVKVKLAKMNKNSDITKPGYLYCKLSKVKVPDCITDFEDYEEFKHFVKDIQKKSLLVYLDELQECLQVIKDFDLFCDQMLCCLQIQFTEDVCPILDEIIQEEEKQNPFPEFQNDQ